MELLAVIVALETLKRPGSDVTVYSDSKYVIDAITKGWVFNWAKKGFSGKKNPDLWRRYLKIHPVHNIRYVWVKGHNNHPQNERCDTLAVNAALSSDLLIDQGYEDSEG
jgi:ribonuclease HI